MRWNDKGESIEVYIKNAEHYLAIGDSTIHLYNAPAYDSPLWKNVISIKPGSSYRFTIPVELYVEASDKSGLKFQWIWKIEPSSSNGHPSFEPDFQAIYDLCRLIPVGASGSLAEVFEGIKTFCQEEAKEASDRALRYYGMSLFVSNLQANNASSTSFTSPPAI